MGSKWALIGPIYYGHYDGIFSVFTQYILPYTLYPVNKKMLNQRRFP